MIKNIVKEKPLPVYGKGDNIRDWLYVEDHVRAIDLILNRGKIGETYLIGGNNEQKNIELVHHLINLISDFVLILYNYSINY
jgi:dTDP-glucose 4,6-dehydratase